MTPPTRPRNRSTDMRLLRHVNRHGVPSPPASMWLCFVFLLRNSLLLLGSAVSSLQGESANWVYGVIYWPVLLFEAPMLLLMAAWARRTPEGGALARWVWHHGRELMTFSAGLDLARAGWYLAAQEVWNPWPERFIAVGAVADLAIIVACWGSPLYRAVFCELPLAPGSADPNR